MEVAWEDRGAIAHKAYFHPHHALDYQFERDWWTRVFDACVSTEKKMVPGGTEILITKEW